MAFTTMFESGGYGDGLSFFGMHRIAISESHLAIMRGTGNYVNAKGYAIVKTFPVANQQNNDGVETLLQITILLKRRDLLLKGLRWKLQNGEHINFWGDSWIPSIKGHKIFSSKPDGCTINMVADEIDHTSKSWNISSLQYYLTSEETKVILAIPIAVVYREDFLVWHPNSSGCYSVKSGYDLAQSKCDSL
ncbi:hypothetical protein ACSBR1_033496 [Camellia fascicularis]